MLLSAAKRGADEVRLTWTTDGDHVVLTVDGASRYTLRLRRV